MASDPDKCRCLLTCQSHHRPGPWSMSPGWNWALRRSSTTERTLGTCWNILEEHVGTCWNMEIYGRHAKICQNMPKYAKICQNMPSCMVKKRFFTSTFTMQKTTSYQITKSIQSWWFQWSKPFSDKQPNSERHMAVPQGIPTCADVLP